MRPPTWSPLVGPGFKPTDKDEQGLWRKWSGSRRKSRARTCWSRTRSSPATSQDIIGTVGGPAAKDFRIYLARIPDFNAMMFPTGFAVVFSGLLLRMRNEASWPA